MVHVGFAMAFRNPEIELADSEGDKLAGAIQKVMRHYDIPDIASETKDWIGLIITCGAIYGPRLMSASVDRAAKKEAEREPSVTEMTVIQGGAP